MKQNVGKTDRIIRILLAEIAGMLLVFNVFSGIWFWIVAVIGVIMLFTAVIKFCPLYPIFKINTCKNTETKTEE